MSITSLAHAQFGSSLCAGTFDGQVVLWDMRNLTAVVSSTRVSTGVGVGVDSLLPHPRPPVLNQVDTPYNRSVASA